MPVQADRQWDARIAEELRAGGSLRNIAEGLGVSTSVVQRVKREIGLEQVEQVEHNGTMKGTENDQTIELKSEKQIRTLEEAVDFADVDRNVWFVRDWECTGWTGSQKIATFNERGHRTKETPVRRQEWRVKLVLRRIMPKSLHDATEAVIARIGKIRPDYSSVPKLVAPGWPHLLVADLVDVHFGKLAWSPETGQNYDLRIAERIYRDAVQEILSRASGFDIEEFLLPLGSDFLHVDGLSGMTTNGTPQDVDGRIAKIIETAEMAVIWAVEEMAKRGRVVVRWIPGNHDRLLSYMLARTIAATFAKHPRVTVDVSPTARKYHRYRKTLIGLTHGNEEKHSSLPGLMATEVPHMWAETTCREWHVGHLHKSKQLAFLPLDTHDGIPVRTLRSLSATDAWHYRKGYVGSQRAAEAYLYDAHGWVGSFVANVREWREAA